MFVSLSNSLATVIVAVLCLQTVAAAPGTPGLSTRQGQGRNVSPCLTAPPLINPGLANGRLVTDWAMKNKIGDAPWLPNCAGIKDGSAEAKCFECEAFPAAAYYVALAGCTAASTGCVVAAPLCEAACIATATYTLWRAEQACYCEHANCADANVRSAGRIGGPPLLDISGQKFKLPMRDWGYAGTRPLHVVRFNANGGAISCA